MIHQCSNLLQLPFIRHGFFEAGCSQMPSLNCAFVKAQPKEQVEEQDTWLRRYLLGELSDEEQQKIEEKLLVDNEYVEQNKPNERERWH